MEQNKVLLSQTEIDTLLSFLLDKKHTVDSAIMDQDSIDKLIRLLQTKDQLHLRFDSLLPASKRNNGNALLILDNNENLGEQAGDCRLCFELLPDGQAEVSCYNEKTKHRFRISPSCYEQLRYFSDESSVWGYSIAPILFDAIASLLHVTYTKDSYTRVCNRFSEINYGSPDAPISPLYLPSDASLIDHLVI